VLGLDAAFPLTFMVYFLLVVVRRGRRHAQGPAGRRAAARRALDVAGKYYVPEVGAFVIYAAMVAAADRVSLRALREETVKPLEIAFWLARLAAFFLLPGYRVLGSQILIVALFALSLDLILGYARHRLARACGVLRRLGAYTAGILAVKGWARADHRASRGRGARRARRLRGELPRACAARTSARLMVTMGIGLLLFEAANRAAFITAAWTGSPASSCGSSSASFPSTSAAKTAYLYSFVVLLGCFVMLKRLTQSPFGLSLRGIRENRSRMHAIGSPVHRRLVAVFTLAAAGGGCRRARSSRRPRSSSASTPSASTVRRADDHGGAGRHRAALRRDHRHEAIFMIAQDYLSGINPVYWQFWLGLGWSRSLFVARGIWGRGRRFAR
jgi:branched-chain amino acid transport system permease protein